MVLGSLVVLAGLLGGAGSSLLGLCGPFTDLAEAGFCPFVLEIFTLGITKGTTPTTYSPDETVSRLQAAAFLSRTVDSVLARGSRRAALGQFWIPESVEAFGFTDVGSYPLTVACDGADVWVANALGSVSRVRASDGRLLETWTTNTVAILSAMGQILVTGATSPGSLYRIDPRLPAGAVSTVASNLGEFPGGIAFDGARVWTANTGNPGSVSIVTPSETGPWSATTITAGFSRPVGVLYDGDNIWVTDSDAGTLLKLDSAGSVLQTVTVGYAPGFPAFDGANIWVPNYSPGTISVVRASSGTLLATLTQGIAFPYAAAFDGRRVLVTDTEGGGVSLWNAATLGFIRSVGAATGRYFSGVCSDGINFWITIRNENRLARF